MEDKELNVTTGEWVAGERMGRPAVFAEEPKNFFSVVAYVFTNATDAHLLAASKELYEALSEIVHYEGGADSPIEDPYVMDRANAALAKARGEDGHD